MNIVLQVWMEEESKLEDEFEDCLIQDIAEESVEPESEGEG
jgi:hypothetical protein